MWWRGAERLSEDDDMTYQGVRADVLRSIVSPCDHEHTIETKEFTLLGRPAQPDFGHLSLSLDIEEGADAPELKSVKAYLAQYRECIISYERAAGLIRDHFMEVYNPRNVDLTLTFEARGGIKSTIIVSEWNEHLPHAGDEIDIKV
jgi:NADPH-dependent 7-cyano-7-deazaguanine reductase QueF